MHPGFVLIIGALLLPLFRGSVLKTYLMIVPILAFISVQMMHDGTYGVVNFMDWELTFGRVDALSKVFGYIMTLMCIIGSMYGLHVKDPKEHMAAWMYVGGSLGVIFCGDYITLFIFWELMAFSSVFLVWFRKRKESLPTGFRYLMRTAFPCLAA
jgi:multicomponent Na+:H+ antiporter subunit D